MTNTSLSDRELNSDTLANEGVDLDTTADEELDLDAMTDEELEAYYTQLIMERKVDYYDIVQKRRKAAKGVIVRYGDYVRTPAALLNLLAVFAVFDAADNFIPGDCIEKLRDLAVGAASKLQSAAAEALQDAARTALRHVALDKNFTTYWRETAADAIRDYDEETANMADALIRAVPIAKVPPAVTVAGIAETVNGAAEALDQALETLAPDADEVLQDGIEL